MFAYHRGASVVFTAVPLISGPFGTAQQAGRTKVAEGEHKVTVKEITVADRSRPRSFTSAKRGPFGELPLGYDLEGLGR